MPDNGIQDLMQATRNLETALAEFQSALKAIGVPNAPAGPVFQALRTWRTEQARARKVPPYVIATDAVLQAIEQAKPQDIESLQSVRGLSPNKVAQYGPDILAVVAKAA